MNTRIQNKHIQNGFAMLFTVLVVSLILTISLSISNITFKQGVLSGLVKDSQIAFYQADAGLECGLYYDVSQELFKDVATIPGNLDCGGHNLVYDNGQSFQDYYVYVDQLQLNKSPNQCFSLVVDKRNAPQTILQSRGNNMCNGSVRQVQRALEAKY